MRTAILLSFVLAGCATGPTPKMLEYKAYVSENLPRAQRGDLKWSEYFTAVYSKAAASNAPGSVLTQMNESIRTAQRYESGAITKEEFDHSRRATHADGLAASQRATEQATSQQSVDSAAMLAAGIQMMQASQPQPVAYPAYQQARGNAYAPGYLRSQSQNGTLRYCNYSNGAIITVAAYQTCSSSTN